MKLLQPDSRMGMLILNQPHASGLHNAFGDLLVDAEARFISISKLASFHFGVFRILVLLRV